ncbi:MAG: hypothetical protein ACRCWM_07465 [Sarcina sp.]
MKKRTNEDFVRELESSNPKYIPLENYINNTTKILFKCKIHNIEFLTTARRALEGRLTCPECLKENRQTRNLKDSDWLLGELKNKNIEDVIPLEKCKGRGKIMLFKCSCGDEWSTTPERVLLGNHCKKCGYEKFSGEKNHFYKPELTEEERNDDCRRAMVKGYATFRTKCYNRDNYTCRVSGKVSTGDILVHHLDGYNWCVENRTNPNNGITLCEEVHKDFHRLYGKGDNTKEQFLEFVETLYKLEKIEKENFKSIKNQIKKIK